MVTPTTARILGHIRQWLNRSHPDPDTDAGLLRRFTEERDESAFAALVDRHGPMVLGVARRVVGDPHTAEDVFQATFLTLARRAGFLRRPVALAAFLHQTAHNIALKALRGDKRRERAEKEAIRRTSENPLDVLSSRELLAILDEELARLPETYRLPLVLCCLEGRSQDEAAGILGGTPGSVKGRLERGRQRLKERLARRGLTFAVGAGVPLLVPPPTLAGLLREAAIQAIRDEGSASAAALALAKGVGQSLMVVSGRTALAVAVVGLVGLGLGLASLSAWQQPAGPAEDPPAAAAKVPPAAPRGDLMEEPLPEGAVKQLGSSRLQIGASAFVLTPDGRTIVAVSPEGIVREFDANTGRFLQRRQLFDRSEVDLTGQCQVQLSADGKTAAIDEWGGDCRRVTVWDVPSGRRIFRRESVLGERSIDGYGLAGGGKHLALAEWVGNEKLELQVVDLDTGRSQGPWQLDLSFPGCEVRLSGDCRRVVVAQQVRRQTDATTFTYFDLAAGKRLWQLPRKGKRWGFGARNWALSADGKTLVSAAETGELGFQIIEIDPVSGQPAERFQPNKEAQSGTVLIAPDNRTAALYGVGRVLVWDLASGAEVRRFKVTSLGVVFRSFQEVFAPDGRSLLSGLGYLQRWDLSSGKPFFEMPPDDGLGEPACYLAFSRDGKEVLAGGGNVVARWDAATGKRLGSVSVRGRWLGAARAGLRLVCSDMSGERRDRIQVLDPRTGKSLHRILWDEPAELAAKEPRASLLTQDGKTLLVVHMGSQGLGQPWDTYVTACDVATGRRLSRFRVPGDKYLWRCCPFSRCGRWVVLNGKVYHIGTGTELLTLTGNPEERLMPRRGGDPPAWFSEDGRLLAAILEQPGKEDRQSTGTLAVWELASGRVLTRIPRGKNVSQVVFTPDGHRLAFFDAQGVRIHDVLTGQQLAAYPTPNVAYDRWAFSQGTQSLAFAPDGRTLASGHEDGAVLLWRVPPTAAIGPPEIGEAEYPALWTDLGSDSPTRARRAVDRLACRPATALALLKARFRPPTPPADSLAALIKDLDSETFTRREEADRKLRAQGVRAETDLRRALSGKPSPEMKRRIEGILEAITRPVMPLPLSGGALRGVRAIEVLERVGTPKARALLQAWADQTRDLRLAAEARTVLERSRP